MNKVNIVFRGGEGGWKNLGDQAMLINAARNLKAKLPILKIIVLTDKKESTYNFKDMEYRSCLYDYLRPRSKIMKGLVWFFKFKAAAELSFFAKTIWIILNSRIKKHLFLNSDGISAIRLLKSADLIYLGGGGYLNDLWPHMLYQITTLCYLGSSFKKPIIMTGQGIGPLKNRWHRWMIKKSLNKVNILTFREVHSNEYALSLGVNKPLMKTVADDALTLPSRPNEQITNLIENSLRPILGVQIRNTNYIEKLKVKEYEKIAAILDSIIKNLDLQILFIPMSFSKNADDMNTILKVRNLMLNKERADFLAEGFDPMEIKYAISKVNYFIGTSYHALLFALSQGVPSIGLYGGEYYSLKIKSLFESFGVKDFILNFEEINLENIESKLYELIKNNAVLKLNLAEKTNNMALASEEIFLDLSNHVPCE